MKNRYTNLLNIVVVTLVPNPLPRQEAMYIKKSRIIAKNAALCGLFNQQDIDALDKRIKEQENSIKRNESRKPKKFTRVTIANATREQVQNALHKITVG